MQLLPPDDATPQRAFDDQSLDLFRRLNVLHQKISSIPQSETVPSEPDRSYQHATSPTIY